MKLSTYRRWQIGAALAVAALMEAVGGGHYPLWVDLVVCEVTAFMAWTLAGIVLDHIEDRRIARACDCGALQEDRPHSLDCTSRFPQSLHGIAGCTPEEVAEFDGESGLDPSRCTCPAPPGYGSHDPACGIYGD